MCLSDFVEFKQIEEENALVGYRVWKNNIDQNNLFLKSENQDYEWSRLEGPHEVKESDSGIYAYSNNYDNYNNNYYYYNNGIISQWGKIAIHKTGYRSEYAKINILFTVRLSDAEGPKKFLDWIKIFNKKVERVAEKYECKVITYQDFKESEKK